MMRIIGRSILIILLLTGGCGVKRMPKPQKPPPPQISSIKAQVKGKVVILKWSVDKPESLDSYSSSMFFKVLRTEQGDGKCAACRSEVVTSIELDKPYNSNEGFSCIDKDVSPLHTYRYRVLLLDQRQRLLSVSSIIQVRVLPSPEAPRILRTICKPEGIEIQWKMPKLSHEERQFADRLRFFVERAEFTSDWKQLNPSPIRGYSFLDATAVDGVIYRYRVTSVLDCKGVIVWGKSSATSQVIAPKSKLPPPPETVWVISRGGKPEIHWIMVHRPVKGYHIYRKCEDEIIRLTASPVTKTPYLDTSARPHETCWYAVSAVSSAAPFKEGLVSRWVEFKER